MCESFICMRCDRRYPVEKAYIKEGPIGICRTCWEKVQCVPPMSPFAGTDSAKVLMSPFYYTGCMRNMILQYKFQGKWLFADVFSRLMLEYVRDFHLEERYNAVVGIPLSRKRLWERGYNQADYLARPIGAALGLTVLDCGVFRKKNTLAQSTLHGRDKYENVRDAFIANRAKIAGRKIILVDDVYTYGATMESCAKELKDKGAAEVLGLTLAVTANMYKK